MRTDQDDLGREAATHDGIYAAVRDAWRETLPKVPFDPAQSWADAGADSLKSLHLVLRLEKTLGRKVPFDLLSREMTARSLAAAIAGGRPTERGSSALPTIFLVPGLLGDEPVLADFRRAMAGALRFELVDLPDLEAPVAVHADVVATARAVADQIARRAPGGDLFLAGFSYGGLVAFEAARLLIAAGRRIAWLGLLDSFTITGAPDGIRPATSAAPSEPDGQEATPAPNRFRLRHGEGLGGFFERALFGLLVHLRLIDAARRWTARHARRLSQDQLVGRRKIVLGFSREQAMRRWAPAPLALSTLLVMTDEGAAWGSRALWARLSARLDVVRIAGKHHDIFTPDALARIRQSLVAAVAEAQGTTR